MPPTSVAQPTPLVSTIASLNPDPLAATPASCSANSSVSTLSPSSPDTPTTNLAGDCSNKRSHEHIEELDASSNITSIKKSRRSSLDGDHSHCSDRQQLESDFVYNTATEVARRLHQNIQSPIRQSASLEDDDKWNKFVIAQFEIFMKSLPSKYTEFMSSQPMCDESSVNEDCEATSEGENGGTQMSDTCHDAVQEVGDEEDMK